MLPADESDSDYKRSLPNYNGVIKRGAYTDEYRYFTVAPVAQGKYTVKVSFAGNNIEVKNVKLAANKTVDLKQFRINTSADTQ